MALTVKNIIDTKLAEAVATTQYVADGVTCIVDKFTATNISGAAATLTVHLVPSGDSPLPENTVTDAVTIGAGKSYTFFEIVGHVLETGDSIATVASDATALVIRASGREIGG